MSDLAAIFGLLAPSHGSVPTRLLRRRLADAGVPETQVYFESPEICAPGRQ